MSVSSKAPWREPAAIIALTLLAGLGGIYVARFPVFLYPRAQAAAQNRTHEFVNHWAGVRVLQYPNDLIVYQEIITEQEPDWIIETGTNTAGLTLYLSSVLHAIKPEAKILTVDIDPAGWYQTTKGDLKNPHARKLLERVEFIEGSSTAPEVIEKMKHRIGTGKKVMVILDSLHTKDHVLNEMKLYGEMVHPGGYMVVTDTHLDALEGTPGPLAAVRAFLANDTKFTPDRSRERFLISANASGWLRKKE